MRKPSRTRHQDNGGAGVVQPLASCQITAEQRARLSGLAQCYMQAAQHSHRVGHYGKDERIWLDLVDVRPWLDRWSAGGLPLMKEVADLQGIEMRPSVEVSAASIQPGASAFLLLHKSLGDGAKRTRGKRGPIRSKPRGNRLPLELRVAALMIGHVFLQRALIASQASLSGRIVGVDSEKVSAWVDEFDRRAELDLSKFKALSIEGYVHHLRAKQESLGGLR